VRKGNDLLRQALNWALFRLWEKGRYTDLWLRYFSGQPVLSSIPRHLTREARNPSGIHVPRPDCFASFE
jgi:hypothetical protein